MEIQSIWIQLTTKSKTVDSNPQHNTCAIKWIWIGLIERLSLLLLIFKFFIHLKSEKNNSITLLVPDFVFLYFKISLLAIDIIGEIHCSKQTQTYVVKVWFLMQKKTIQFNSILLLCFSIYTQNLFQIPMVLLKEKLTIRNWFVLEIEDNSFITNLQELFTTLKK